MVRRYTLFFLLLLAVMGLVVGGFGHTEEKVKGPSEMEVPPAEIILMYPLRGTVLLRNFTHEAHFKDYKITCNVCHHVYEKGENVWKRGMPVKRCEECHNETAVKGEKRLIPALQIEKLISQKICQDCHSPRYGCLLPGS